jgi:hypothetical protein
MQKISEPRYRTLMRGAELTLEDVRMADRMGTINQFERTSLGMEAMKTFKRVKLVLHVLDAAGAALEILAIVAEAITGAVMRDKLRE